MKKTIENKELFEYLEKMYIGPYSKFELKIKSIFPTKKLDKTKLDHITSLRLDSLSSVCGIEELNNLEDLTLTNIYNMPDLNKIHNLESLSLDLNKGNINIEEIISISKNDNFKKIKIFGNDVMNITPDQILQFGPNTLLSYDNVYSFTTEQFHSIQTRIIELKKLVTKDMSDFDKVSIMYKHMLTDSFEYDYDNKSSSTNGFLVNSTLYGPLVLKKGVCSGISAALEVTLKSIGLEANSCGGWLDDKPSSGNMHQWNQVKIDGQWYNLDLTNDYDKNPWRFFLKSDLDTEWSKLHCRNLEDTGELFYKCNSTKYDNLFKYDIITRNLLTEQKNDLEQMKIDNNLDVLTDEDYKESEGYKKK
ncbi:MAG: transglutaminase-like domain-containing protein [bacterium]